MRVPGKVIILYVNNEHLTRTEKNTIRPEMDKIVKAVLGDKIVWTGNGYGGCYHNQTVEMDGQELVELVRKIAKATTGKGPLEVQQFSISDNNTMNGFYFCEVVKR